MEIVRLTEITDSTIKAFDKLISELLTTCQSPTSDYLEEIINSTNTIIFIAKDGAAIVGTLSLVVYKIPSGIKASIEDVVVDRAIRGKGIGEALVKYAIGYSMQLGVMKIDLTSNPNRIAANKLYQKLNFEKRETNVYRLNCECVDKSQD